MLRDSRHLRPAPAGFPLGRFLQPLDTVDGEHMTFLMGTDEHPDLDVVTLIRPEHRRERVAVGETRGQWWIEVGLLVEVGDLSDDLRAVGEGQITGLSGSLLGRTAARILNPERDRLVAVVDGEG